MRKALRRVIAASRLFGAVVARRLRHGPARPTWPLGYEVAVTLVRSRFGRDVPYDVARRGMDRVPVFGAMNGVRSAPRTIGGVRCLELSVAGADDRVLVYLHGGGYCVGSPRSHLPILGALARGTGARVLALDYRLAPEHPCPAAIHDVLAVLRGLAAEGVQPSRTWISGDSAGGGLTLTSLVAARDAGLPALAGAIPISPWTDLTGSQASHVMHVHDYLPGPDQLVRYARAYAGGLALDDPRVSPLFADLSGLPPLLVLVGGAERLHDDGVALAERARAQGVSVELHVEPDEIHVWPMFGPWSPNAADAVRRIASFMA
jgi:acetyl esterase/lipase